MSPKRESVLVTAKMVGKHVFWLVVWVGFFAGQIQFINDSLYDNFVALLALFCSGLAAKAFTIALLEYKRG